MQRSGTGPVTQHTASCPQANVPLSEMFQYVSNLRGMTKGRAQYSMQLEKYEVVPPQVRNLRLHWCPRLFCGNQLFLHNQPHNSSHWL